MTSGRSVVPCKYSGRRRPVSSVGQCMCAPAAVRRSLLSAALASTWPQYRSIMRNSGPVRASAGLVCTLPAPPLTFRG
eukprot:541738-Prymnesium_polylepis.1